MKITIESDHNIVTVEDKTGKVGTDALVELVYDAMLATGHSPSNIAQHMCDVGSERFDSLHPDES